MDPMSVLKSYAHRIRARPLSTIALNHGQALEIAVSLVSPARSWNVFAAVPHEPHVPKSVEDYLARIVAAQRRIAQLKVAPTLSRGERAYAAIECYAAMTQTPLFAQLWELLDAAGVSRCSIVDGGVSRQMELADAPRSLSLRLATWYFDRQRKAYWPWDETERVALAMGYSKRLALNIRELQREAPKYCWDLDLWFEVGVLYPDQRAFLQELQEEPLIKLRSQMRDRR